MDQLLGKINRLYVLREATNGVYLGIPEQEDISILLPKNQVPEGTEKGSIMNLFVYKDSEDRPIATTTTPLITLGQLARLTVKQVTPIGAFLDWGLTKDLLLPFKEQTVPVKENDQVFVALYLDKSSRLCATMRVYEYLETNSDYKTEDRVTGVVYELIDNFGVFVIIDDKYSALIPPNEANREFHIGDTVSARVKEVREDGKLTLSLTEKIPLQMGVDATLILARLEDAGGFLPFHDKTNPEVIKKEFQMSKNAFKRAIGRLMKEKEIAITENGIERIK